MIKEMSLRNFYSEYNEVKGLRDRLIMSAIDSDILFTLFNHFNPKIVVEFGVRTGKTARELLNRFDSVEKYIGVDLLNLDTVPEWQRSETLNTNDVAKHVKHNEKFTLILSNNGTFDLKPNQLGNIDLLFIDSGHCYDTVWNDSKLAKKCVKAGVVIWHDYMNGIEDYDKGLREISEELFDIVWVKGTTVCFSVIE